MPRKNQGEGSDTTAAVLVPVVVPVSVLLVPVVVPVVVVSVLVVAGACACWCWDQYDSHHEAKNATAICRGRPQTTHTKKGEKRRRKVKEVRVPHTYPRRTRARSVNPPPSAPNA